jgi:1,4-alpha-glucan branching enzyme
VWDNGETHWMWQPIHEAETRMEKLVERYPDASGDTLYVLNQTARELLLLQSSDWPFLVTTGQAREYAIQRFSQHLERYGELADSLEAGNPDTERAGELWEMDKVFPDIDYRWWAAV